MDEVARLGSIDALPDRGLPALRWVFTRIREERMTQTAMRKQFNAKLAEVGLPPVSASAFNRYVHRVRGREVGEPPMPVPADGAIAAAMGGELETLRSALVQAVAAVDKLMATAARPAVDAGISKAV